MNRLPDWLLDGYTASQLPEFVSFAQAQRVAEAETSDLPAAVLVEAADQPAPSPHPATPADPGAPAALPDGYALRDYADLSGDTNQHGVALVRTRPGDPNLPAQLGLDGSGGPTVLRLAFALPLEGSASSLWQLAPADWQQLLLQIASEQSALAALGEVRTVIVKARATTLHLKITWSAERPASVELACQLFMALKQAQFLVRAREWSGTSALRAPAIREVTLPADDGTGMLTQAHREALERQYELRHSGTPRRATTTLQSRFGDASQAIDPPWPQDVTLSGVEGEAGIEIMYLIPAPPGEDLEACARAGRDAILEALPPAWRNPDTIMLIRYRGRHQLSVICGYPLSILPPEAEHDDLVREVAVRCAEQRLYFTLTRMAGAHLLPVLGGPEPWDVAQETEEELPADGPSWDEVSLSLTASSLRSEYEAQLRHDEEGKVAGSRLLLNPQGLETPGGVPFLLELMPSPHGMTLALWFKPQHPLPEATNGSALKLITSTLDTFATILHVKTLASVAPEFHPLHDTLGTLYRGLLIAHWQYGTALPESHERRVELLFRVAAVCELTEVGKDLSAVIADTLEFEGALEEEAGHEQDGSGQDSATRDGAVVLSPRFLSRAGFRELNPRGEAFTAVQWEDGERNAVTMFRWVEPSREVPYPLLAVHNTARIPEAALPQLFAGAVQDHFRSFSGGFVLGLLSRMDETWVTSRTLTPAVSTQAVGEGMVGVTTVRCWPVIGTMTPALLHYMANAAYGQFDDMMQRAGIDVEPDFTPPPPAGRGQRDWLDAGQLQQLVGSHWPWHVAGDTEIRCSI